MQGQRDNLLRQIVDGSQQLTKSERRIADVVVRDPVAVTRLSIGRLAQAASVSEPTVNRFCRKFEPRGYPEFKLRLAQSLVQGVPYVNSTIAPGDDTATYTAKILDGAVASLRELGAQLPETLIEAAVEHLLRAKRIFFFGLGVSSAVAQDALHHFFRFALPVSASGDVLLQRMQAGSASASDVFFLISHTGRTRDIVDIAKLARRRGAVVISLTARGSLLAQSSTLAMELDVDEDTDTYMPMTSRMAHLAVLDILAAGVTLRRGSVLQPHLRAIKDSLMETRYTAATPELSNVPEVSKGKGVAE